MAWIYISPGPAVPRVKDVNAEVDDIEVIGWYDGPDVEELPIVAQNGDSVRWEGRLYVWGDGLEPNYHRPLDGIVGVEPEDGPL